MFQSVLDALLEWFERVLVFIQELLEDYFPFDLTDIDPVGMLEFANNGLISLNRMAPVNECLVLLLTGASVKYSIRLVRLVIGPLG